MGEVAWSLLDVVSADVLPEGNTPEMRVRIAALAGIYGPLKVSRFDGVRDGEKTITIYSVQVMEPRSVFSKLGGPAYHGPGSARESLTEAVDALTESVVRHFRGCTVVRPNDGGDGIYGPSTWEKDKRAEVLGLIPSDWPATPGLVQSSSSSSSSSSS